MGSGGVTWEKRAMGYVEPVSYTLATLFSRILMLQIQNLIDDAKCYEEVRKLRWPDGVQCPHCYHTNVIKRGFDEKEPHRQKYYCHQCERRFDDLTNTVFSGHHQPLRVWILCLYFMGLNLSKDIPGIIPQQGWCPTNVFSTSPGSWNQTTWSGSSGRSWMRWGLCRRGTQRTSGIC